YGDNERFRIRLTRKKSLGICISSSLVGAAQVNGFVYFAVGIAAIGGLLLGSKLFAVAYALFSGLVFMGVAGVLLAPFAHRLVHRFHLETGAERNAVRNGRAVDRISLVI
ncbi:MAG: hypothetical protein M3Y84_10290, partial [Acidobacteriota bacterium]|nr:hypothetical protein [Acidobacteriota bacterium]